MKPKKSTSKTKSKTTSGFVNQTKSVSNEPVETPQERQIRWKAIADELYNLRHFGTKGKPDKSVKTELPPFPKFSKSYSDTPDLTIQQEDIKYREQMRESMEDDDIFSYHW